VAAYNSAMDEYAPPTAAEDDARAPAGDAPLRFTPHPLRFDEVRVENTNHCGYNCFMCPRDKLTRDLGFMPIEDFDLVVGRLGDYRGQIHLHGFGEPLLDNELAAKVRRAKTRCPDTHVMFFTTLGVKKNDRYFRELAASGVGHIRVSFYGFSPETYKKVAGVNTFDLAKRNLQTLAEARAAVGADFDIMLQTWSDEVWSKWPAEARRRRDDFLRWTDEIGVLRNAVDIVHNYGGGRAYNEPPAEGLCSVAWGMRRRILQVTWDLDIIPCCFDFNASVPFGNLRTHSLEEIFAGETYRNFIDAHLANRIEDYPVCVGCERCFQP